MLSAPNRAIAYAWLDAMRNTVVIADNFAYTTVVTLDAAMLPATGTVDNTGFSTEASEPLTLPTDKTGWAHVTLSTPGSTSSTPSARTSTPAWRSTPEPGSVR